MSAIIPRELHRHDLVRQPLERCVTGTREAVHALHELRRQLAVARAMTKSPDLRAALAAALSQCGDIAGELGLAVLQLEIVTGGDHEPG